MTTLNKVGILLGLLGSIFISGCNESGPASADHGTSDSTSSGSDAASGTGAAPKSAVARFLIFQPEPKDEKLNKAPKLLSIDDSGTVKTQPIDASVYPRQGYGGSWKFLYNIDAYGNNYVMTLHQDFDSKDGYTSNAALVDVSAGSHKLLPLVDAEDTRHYKYYLTGSARMDRSQHVFYVSATDHVSYGDDPGRFYIRYAISDGSRDQAIPCTAFIKAQPEKGVDTEDCIMSQHYLPSNDGRYIYGNMTGDGVDGGVNHYDYTVLYQYDFDTKQYARLAPGERDVTFRGVTSDGRHIVFSNDGTLKVLDLASGTVRSLKNIQHWPLDGYYMPNKWNGSGVLVGTTVALYFVDVVNDREFVLVDQRVDNEQFAEKGDAVYFTLHDEATQTLYKTKGLVEKGPYDVVATLGAYTELVLLQNGGAAAQSSNGGQTVPPPAASTLASCLYGDDIFNDNCIDRYPVEWCTTAHLESVKLSDLINTPVTNPQSCVDLGYDADLSIENSEGYREYFN
jgi:hypothetical protein